MDDITSKISELISDPDGMAKIQEMAKSLFGENSESHESPKAKIDNELSIPDIDMSSILKAVSFLRNSDDDKRSELLKALKPYLSSERQKRVDSALKLIRIIHIIPILKEQGLIDLL